MRVRNAIGKPKICYSGGDTNQHCARAEAFSPFRCHDNQIYAWFFQVWHCSSLRTFQSSCTCSSRHGVLAIVVQTFEYFGISDACRAVGVRSFRSIAFSYLRSINSQDGCPDRVDMLATYISDLRSGFDISPSYWSEWWCADKAAQEWGRGSCVFVLTGEDRREGVA